MFCKFCGREIPAGGVCDCEGSRRALAGQAPQPGPAPQQFNQAPQPGPAPQQFNQAPQPGPAPQQFNQGPIPGQYGGPQKAPGSSVVGDTFKLLGGFFKAPGSAMMDAYTGKANVKAAIGTGIVYAIVLLISLIIPFAVTAGGKGVGLAFLFAVLVAGVRMGMAALIAAFGKKNGASFSRVLGATSVGAIPVIGLMFIGGLLLLASQTVGMIFIVISVVVVVGVYAKMFGAVMVGDPNRLYWMGLGVTAIYALVIYILYQLAVTWVMRAALSSALGGLLGGLSSFF